MSNNSQRRSRYTVYIEGSEPRVCLCYTADYAVSFYERKGLVVTKVVKGDYRKKRRQPKPSTGLRLDERALQDAIDLMDLKIPVKVRFHARAGNTNGNHTLRIHGVHDIMIKSYLSRQEASETLWHELTHARQAEQAGGYTGWVSKSKEQRSYSYQIRPIEIEAREVAEQMKDLMLFAA